MCSWNFEIQWKFIELILKMNLKKGLKISLKTDQKSSKIWILEISAISFLIFERSILKKKTESLYCLKEVCYQKVKMYGLSRLDAAGLRWESGKRVQTLKIGFRLNRPNRKSHTGHKSQFRANFCRKARFKSKLVKKHREQYTL